MNAHRSYSQLSNYLHCGHAYYLTKVKRFPEAPSVWLAGGRAFHSTTEGFDEWSTPGAVINEESWQDAFTIQFETALDEQRKDHPDESKWRTAGRPTKDKPHGEDINWWHTAGREMVAGYTRWRAENNDVYELAVIPDSGLAAIEVELTTPLGVPMKGWADRIFRAKNDGRLVVVDLKSGSRMPYSPVQLATYSVQAEKIFGEPVLWGAFYDARKQTLAGLVDLTTWTESKLGRVYSTLDRGISTDIFLPHIDSHCGKCSVRQFCIYQGGQEPADNTKENVA